MNVNSTLQNLGLSNNVSALINTMQQGKPGKSSIHSTPDALGIKKMQQ
jgi:hypothetical protein